MIAANWPVAGYWEALRRTNTTGLASLRDYRQTLGASSCEAREWLAGFTYLLLSLPEVNGRWASDLMMLGTYPPEIPLSTAVDAYLAHLEEVVTATGTQVLEMRGSDDPRAVDFTARGRLDCACDYLTFGGRDASALRTLVWVRGAEGWELSGAVATCAELYGFTRAEYVEFQSLHNWFPDVASEQVAAARQYAKKRIKRGFVPAQDEDDRPWLTFLDATDLPASKP